MTTTTTLKACKPGICTMSLGRYYAGHSLEHKLDMAQKYSLVGIELFYEDLRDVASSMSGGCTNANQLLAAAQIRKWCSERDIEVICLQPFMHYEGLLDRAQHKKHMEILELWMQLARNLGTDLIVFPSSFLSADLLTEDWALIVDDFAQAADLGLRQDVPIRFAFEALCWGTRINTWEASWDIVRAVHRPNFGLCLDTFNIAGRVYADPSRTSGCTANCERDMITSMTRLLNSVDVSKIFLLQVADAERLSQPLGPLHPYYDAAQPARMSWSRNCRLFYGEAQYGAYLPVRAVLETVLRGLGYRGWLSFEMFNRAAALTDEGIPEHLAQRAAASWKNLVDDLGIESANGTETSYREVTRAAL